MAFNDDMDRYMHGRRRSYAAKIDTKGSGWWERTFFPRKDSDNFTHDEIVKVTAMEQDIKKGEERLSAAETPHEQEMLAEKQEERVSLYQKFLGIFKVERKMEDEYQTINGEQLHAKVQAPEPAITEDFKTLAQIQLRWFERMPTRIKEEFRESEDYEKYKEILMRRGVVKK